MIDVLNTAAERWYTWQLAMLWQVAILIAIVWGIDRLIRKWAWPQVRYALWLLVLVKLLVPPTVSSPVSVTSGIPTTAQKAVSIQIAPGQRDAASVGTHPTPPKQPVYNIPAPEQAQAWAQTAPSGQGSAEPVIEETDIPMGRGDAALKPPRVEEIGGGEPSLSWTVYAMGLWLAGIVILTVWLLRRLSGLRHEHHDEGSHVQLPQRFEEQLQAAARKLKLRRLPEVVLTDKVCCPAVFGIVRPVLLMPAAKFKYLSNRDTEHVLLHELAHIKRGDLWVHGVYMLLQIVYWFNPLLWLIRKTLQNLRELCCDATVARLLREDTVYYRRTLLETARRLVAEPVDPGLGLLGLFENSNWLLIRLQWLEKKTWKNRRLRIAAVITLVAVMAACVLPMANRLPETYVRQVGDIQIELIAVNHSGADSGWWKPDGSPCEMAIQTEDRNHYPADNPGYEFIFRIQGGDHPRPRLAVKGSNPQSGLDVTLPEGLTGWRCHIKAGYKETTANVGVLGDDWETIAAYSGRGSDGRVIFSPAQQTSGGLSVTISDDFEYGPALRLVAVDTNGAIHTGRMTGDLLLNGLHQQTWQFDRIEQDRVEEFQLQSQDYAWVTFKDVALRPDEERLKLQGIDEQLGISDKSGSLTIHRLSMDPPDDKVEDLRLRVTNTAQQPVYLGLEYYADSGTVAGLYSPGAMGQTEVQQIAADWKGIVTFPVRHKRFTKNGTIHLILAKCSDAKAERFLPPAAEVLLDETYPVFSEEGDFAVTGTVTDAETGAPIGGAEVYDDGYNDGKYRTTTDENGHFTLYTANEEHNISAGADGYQSQMKTLTTFPFANHENFNFKLLRETQDSRFVRVLPDGGVVKLVALFRPKDDPIVFWGSDGRVIDGPALTPDQLHEAKKYELAYVLQRPAMKINGSRENPSPDGNFYSVNGWKPFQLESDDPLVIKRASGYENWEDMGTIKEGQDLGNYHLTDVEEVAQGPLKQVRAKMFWKFNPDFGIHLVAVDKNGGVYPMEASDTFLGEFRKGQRMLYYQAAMGLNKNELSHFKLQKRPLFQVTFEGFALTPEATQRSTVKNIALRPGDQTDVEGLVDDEQMTEERPAEAGSGSETIPWRESAAMLDTLRTALRVWGAKNPTAAGSWTQDELTLGMLEFEPNDITGDYFSAENYTWQVFRNAPYEELIYQITATAGNRWMTIDQDHRYTNGKESEPSSDSRHSSDQKTGATSRPAQASVEVVLPDVDRTPVMLDLASGVVLDLPETEGSPEQVLAAIDRLGKGDLIYEHPSGFVFLRGADTDQSSTHPEDIPVAVYAIDDAGQLPKTIVVTTGDGHRYDLEILGADEQGCRIRYTPLAGQAAEQPMETDDRQAAVSNDALRNVLVQQREVLQAMLAQQEQQYEAGVLGLDAVNETRIKLLRVEARLADSREQRIAALKQVVDLYRRQEQLVQQRVETGRGAASDLNAAKLQRLEAEQAVAEAAAEEAPVSAPQPDDPLMRKVQRISFKKDMPLTDVLDMLSQMYQINIVPSEKTMNPRSVVPFSNLYDVTFEDVLKALCGTTHTYIIEDNFVYVYTNDEFNALPRKPDSEADARSQPPDSASVDLVPAGLTLHHNPDNRAYYLRVSIPNETDAVLPRHDLRFYRGDLERDLDETGNPHSGYHQAGPIEAGGTWNERTGDFFLPDGDYTFTVVLDYNNAIAETDESNNRATLQVTLRDGQIIQDSDDDRQTAFCVYGRVTDSDGKPMSGVTVRASCGMGTLLPTGRTVSGDDGTYRLTFGPGGYRVTDTDQFNVGFQAATIYAEKNGYYEQNLCRHANLAMAGSRQISDEHPSRDGFTGVVLPDQPYELNFVMAPASFGQGRVTDPSGDPIAGFKMILTGQELYPSTSILKNIVTDEDGRFSIDSIPANMYRLEHPTSDGPALGAWITYDPPAVYTYNIVYDAVENRLKDDITGVYGLRTDIMREQMSTPLSGN